LVDNSYIKIGGMTSRKGIVIRGFYLLEMLFEKIHEVLCTIRILQAGIQDTQGDLSGCIGLLQIRDLPGLTGFNCLLRGLRLIFEIFCLQTARLES